MRKSVFTVWGVALGLMAGLMLSGCGKDEPPVPTWGPTTRPSKTTTSAGKDLTVESATARLVGNWEAKPMVDEAVARAQFKKAGMADDKIAEALAGMKNMDITWTLVKDGRMTEVVTGPKPQTTLAMWEIISVTGNVARLSRKEPGKAAEESSLAFESPDRFNTSPADLKNSPYELPIVFNRGK